MSEEGTETGCIRCTESDLPGDEVVVGTNAWKK